jgi:hypothetical protein
MTFCCAFRERLDELDADVDERCNVWVEQARSQVEAHEVRSKEELEAFYAVIRDVEADIVFLEVCGTWHGTGLPESLCVYSKTCLR